MNSTLRRGALALVPVLLAACPDHEPYVPPGGVASDISIEAAQFSQGVQTADGTLPMVLGDRAAVVNVLLRASTAVTRSTRLVLRLLNGAGAVVYSDTAVVTSVPASTPGYQMPSAQFLVPATTLVSGLKWEVLRDPLGELPDLNAATDRFPRDGPATLAVASAPLLKLRFVPITLAAHNGETGNVSSANEYLRSLLSVMPVSTLAISIGAPFSTNASFGTPPSGGASGFWTQVLSELDAARVAAGSDEHWIGVVAPPAGFTFTESGGFAYIPTSYSQTGTNTRTVVLVNVGWFSRPTQSRDLVAHELGHNFGRLHSPCGGPTNLDPSYPHADGTIGYLGHDVYARANGLTTTAGTVAASTGDVMGYCFPVWASSYTYSAVLSFRGTAAAAPPAPAPPEPVLMVRGTVDGNDITLEPAAAMVARPTPAGGRGRYRLVGVDSGGSALFDYAFEPARLDHAALRQFTVAVPQSARLDAGLAAIRVVAPAGRTTELRASRGPAAAAAAARSATLARVGDRVRVDCGRGSRGIAVQEARSGTLLGLAREGAITVVTRPGVPLSVSCGDGVRTRTWNATAP